MARATIWGLKVVAVVLGLLLMAPDTMQVAVNHPMHALLQRINDNQGPFLVLFLSSSRDEQILMRSGYFTPNSAYPELMYAGRKFSIGTFKGQPAIVHRVRGPMANIGATAQIVFILFRIKGVIHYGAAGAVGDELALGDVVVPEAVAHTGNVNWQAYEASLEGAADVLPSLKFGDYNVPKPGENRLGRLQHQTSTLYTPTGQSKDTFWVPVDTDWLRIASSIKSIPKQMCISETSCGLSNVKVNHGTKAASADIYVSNEAYAEHLKKLGADSVDTTSMPIVLAANANGVPHIVFRGLSNRPGMNPDNETMDKAAENVLNAVAEFADRITPTSRYSGAKSY